MLPLTFARHALDCLPALEVGAHQARLMDGAELGFLEQRLQARCLLCFVDGSLDLPRAVGYCLQADNPDLALRLLGLLLPLRGKEDPGRRTGPAAPGVRVQGAPGGAGGMGHFEAFAAAVDRAESEAQQDSKTEGAGSKLFSTADPEVSTVLSSRYAPSEADIRVTRAEVFHQLVTHWLEKGCPKEIMDRIWKYKPEGYSVSSLLRITRATLGSLAQPFDSKIGGRQPQGGARRLTIGELKPHLKMLMRSFQVRSDERHATR